MPAAHVCYNPGTTIYIVINRICGGEIIEQGDQRVVVECPIRIGGALWRGNNRGQREAVGKPPGQPVVHDLSYIVATLTAPIRQSRALSAKRAIARRLRRAGGYASTVIR
jgi:hypothetical protein